MNLAALRWDTELCRAFGVPIEALAPILPTTGPFGAIEGIPLRASIVDQQAALYGHGCRNYGDAKITFGTGAFALALTGTVPAVTRSVGLIATVAWSNGRDTHYALEGGVYDAGAVIEWAQRIGLIDEVATLHSFNAPAAIARGPVFVPALSGLACPQWERRARGSWTQLSLETTRQDLQQSLLEGVALQTQTVLAAMEASIPLGQTLSVDGGLTESPYFLQFLADVVGKRIVRRESQELTAYGCALLAGYESSAADSGVPTVFDPAIAEHERARYIERYGAAAQSAVRLSATEKVALESASA
jgi:glycerol kinase